MTKAIGGLLLIILILIMALLEFLKTDDINLEAHDLTYGNGEIVSPREHLRRQGLS